MGRKKKFGEETVTIGFKVPKSKAEEFKKIAEGFLIMWVDDELKNEIKALASTKSPVRKNVTEKENQLLDGAIERVEEIKGGFGVITHNGEERISKSSEILAGQLLDFIEKHGHDPLEPETTNTACECRLLGLSPTGKEIWKRCKEHKNKK